jgi:signal transduction histidine kinase/CheY-like chemotaxis protein
MTSIQNASIRRKIRRMIILTCGCALLLTGTVVVLRDLIGESAQIKDSLSVIAEMTGSNIASALVFQDPKTAGETLSALKAEPQIQHAFLFSADGGLFAAYRRYSEKSNEEAALLNSARQWIRSTPEKNSATICEFKGASLYVRHAVASHDEPLGMLFLQADMSDLGKRLLLLALTVLSGLVVSLGAAYLLSIRFQRLIVDPVFHLKEQMGQVTRHRDYTVRADSFYPDEIGELIDGFNAMIETIQAWDQALRHHGEKMEQEVANRTEELVGLNDTLTRTVADLRVAIKASQAANLAKTQFLANMSHEIRTPMNGVLGMAELLLTTDLNDKQRHLAETVLQSGTSLLNVLNDILDYSKIEAGKVEIECIDFDLRECVEDVMQIFADSAHKKGIELACLVPDDVSRAFQGDPGRLRQILTNIIGNAVKFTERGEVFVRVTAFEHGLLRFEIRDTGIGIAPEIQEHIFEAFSQADGTTTRVYGGTGLGLAISKQLVEMMGGEIAVESAPGSGSTFRFTLRMKISAAQPQQPVMDRRADLQGALVLVVDDNATNRDILHQQVLSWGMRNACAENAQDALKMLREKTAAGDPYELAILDMMMPGMDGLELARAIQADPAISALPMIMLTSLNDDFESGALRKDGICAYLTKPVRQSQLYNCIATVTRAVPVSVSSKGAENDDCVKTQTFPGTRVLLAEDNSVNQQVAQAMLMTLGCHVEVVSNGQEALDVLSAASFDLVLMDCQMPVLDGYSATASIREKETQKSKNLPQQRGATPRTRIIALTANAMQGDRERCLSAGMDDYLSKPFNLDGLSKVLKRCLPLKTPAELSITHDTGRNAARKKPEIRDSDRAISSRHRTLGGPEASEGGFLDRLFLLESLDRQAWESLGAMKSDGQPSLLHKVMRRYLENTPVLMKALCRAITSGDASSMKASAHSLLSANGFLGAKRLIELSKELQHLGETGAVADAVPLLPVLEAEFEKVRDAFHAELRNTAGFHSDASLSEIEKRKTKGNIKIQAVADHVDFKAIESIESLQRSGMPDMLSKVIGIYLRDTPKQLENAREALVRNDADTMGKQAHSMKSSSATLGAHALAALCKEMEAKGRAGTIENAADLLSRMEAEYAHVAKILTNELR